jgi:hypothetical protein
MSDLMKHLRTGAFLILAPLVVMTAVSSNAIAQEASLKSPQFTAARLAERYLATHYPDFDSIRSPPVVNDKVSAWEVSYELPPNFSGGTPVILIDKTSLRILQAYREQ